MLGELERKIVFKRPPRTLATLVFMILTAPYEKDKTQFKAYIGEGGVPKFVLAESLYFFNEDPNQNLRNPLAWNKL